MSRETISWDEIEEGFRDALDLDGDLQIGGIYFAPSFVLEKCDPIAYRVGLTDYADALSEDYDIEEDD